jgi:hypothetical protein
VYPSHLRSVFERVRQMLTDKQPYRCHQCGWRRWRAVLLPSEGPAVTPEDLRTGPQMQPVSMSDLDQLDGAPRTQS